MVLGPTNAGQSTLPPIVLLGGTSQWLDSWNGHLRALSRRRKVLLYETRGQGGGFAPAGGASSSRQFEIDGALGLFEHADDFWDIVQAADLFDGSAESGSTPTIDVVAFSFGARVAMAAAVVNAQQQQNQASPPPPACIRRLCLTGVAADRGPRGRLALESWRSALSSGDLTSFVWRLILDTYSTRTLAAYESRVEEWVRLVVAANSLRGVRAIVDHTHTEDPRDQTHPLTMAAAIREHAAVESGLLICGEEDMLVAPAAGQALAEAAGGWEYVEVAGAAHAVPIEAPAAWQKVVLKFLDAP